MSSEHHMWAFYSIYSVFFTVSLNVSPSDSFDARSFFQLHDLNRRVQHRGLCHALRAYRRVLETGVWDKDEIQAIYGMHHVYAQKQSKV